MTPADIYAFIKAFPAFVSFMQTAYGDFIKMQIRAIDAAKDEKINELNTEILRLKNAKTNSDIAGSVATINRR